MDGTLSDLERRALRGKARDAVLSSLRALGGEAKRQPLLAHAEAQGGFTERELAAPAPATAKHDRLVDHELSWSLTNLRRDGLVENPRRSVWALAGAAECDRVHHSHHGRPSTNARRAARRKAKREAAVRDLVLRACLAGGLLVGLLGMLER